MNQLTQPTPEVKQLHRQLQWQLFNDDVMGGRSSSAFAWQGECLTFSGFVNTNGGGFASIRTEPDPELAQNFIDITSPEISIELQGDVTFGVNCNETTVPTNFHKSFLHNSLTCLF